MIKIKGQFENGAQMRQELLALLGMDGAQSAVNPLPVVPQQEATSGPVEDITEPGVEEKPKTKRRTKAELEAEALKANTGTEEPPASEENIAYNGLEEHADVLNEIEQTIKGNPRMEATFSGFKLVAKNANEDEFKEALIQLNTNLKAIEDTEKQILEPTTTDKPKYTLDDAKLAAAKLSRTGPEFRNKAKDIAFKYAQFTNPGVDKDAALVPKIAPEHYEAFIAEIEEAGK